MEEDAVELTLFNPRDNKSYKLYVSLEDAERAKRDEHFVQSLLFHAKATAGIAIHNVEESNYDDTEPTEHSNEENDLNLDSTEDTFSVLKERNLSWSYEESLALICSVESHYDDLNHIVKRKKIWDIISTEMESLNYKRTARQVQEKWKNLLRTYKSAKDKQHQTGRGPTRFNFYDKMDSFLGHKPSMTTKDVINVGCESVNTSQNNDVSNVESFEAPQPSEEMLPSTSGTSKTLKKRKTEKSSLNEYIVWKKAQAEKRAEEREKRSLEKASRHKEKLNVEQERNELLRLLLESRK